MTLMSVVDGLVETKLPKTRKGLEKSNYLSIFLSLRQKI